MTTDHNAFWDTVGKIQAELDNAQLATFVDRSQTITRDLQQQTVKPAILIVGAIGSGKSSFANALLQQNQLLPMTRIPKQPLRFNIHLGSSNDVQFEHANDEKQTTHDYDYDDLKKRVTRDDTLQSVSLDATHHLLERYDVIIVPYDLFDKSDDWMLLFGRCAYVFQVMQAGSLLHEDDRRFISDILQPLFPLARVSFVVNQFDVIVEDDDRAQLRDYLTSFVKALGNVRSTHFLSSLQATKQLANDETSATAETIDFDVIRADLSAVDSDTVIEQTMATLRTNLVTQIERFVLAQRDHVMSEWQIDVAVSNDDWLSPIEERKARISEQVNVFIGELIQDDFQAELQGFKISSRMWIVEQLGKKDGHSKQQIQAELQNRLETFLANQIERTKERILVKLDDIGGLIDRDMDIMSDTLNIHPDKFLTAVSRSPLITVENQVMSQHEGGNTVVRATVALQLAGVVMLFFGRPLIALTCVGIGQLVRFFTRQTTRQSQVDGLQDALFDALERAITDVNRNIEREFNHLTQTLQEEIDRIYSNIINTVAAERQRNNKQKQHIQSQIDRLDNLIHGSLARLKQLQ